MNCLVVSVLTLLLLQLTLSANASWFSNKEDPFKVLNTFLVSNEPSEEFRANLRLVKRSLEAKKDAKSPLLEAKTSFASLDGIDEDNLCSSESVRLLANVVKTMQHYTRNPFQDKRIRERPMRFVIHLLMQNAIRCNKLTYFNWGPKKVYFQVSLPAQKTYTLVLGMDEGFELLNNFLTHKVHSMDVADNLQSVEEQHAEYLRLGVEHDAYLEAMEQFTSLRALLKSGQCSRENSKLAADFLTSLRSWAPNPYTGPEAKTKLVQVVATLMRDRAANCLHEYALEWKKTRPHSFDKLQQIFGDFSNRLVESSECKFTEKFSEQRVEDLNCVILRSRADLAIDRVNSTGESESTSTPARELLSIIQTIQMTLASQTPLRSLTLRRSALSVWLNQLLIKPCTQLLGHKSSTLLMKSFETCASIHPTVAFFRLAANYDNQVGILMGELIDWTTYYGVCKRLTDTNRDRLISDLLWIFPDDQQVELT